MDDEVSRDEQDAAVGRRAVRAGLSAGLLWVGIEFGIRTAGGLGIGLTYLAATGWGEFTPGHIGTLSFGLLVPAMLLLWVAFDRRIRRDRISLSDLGHRFTPAAGLTGIACGICLLGVVWLTAGIDTRIFGPNIEFVNIVAATPVLGILALLVGNGLLAPIVEELAWRGYIQGRLALGWGPRAALVATALLFAGKHMVVDVSLSRSVTLVVGSLALGVIRDRWGTFGSTLAHFAMNFTATTAVIFEALTR
jgi:membrane protease YdiL (CAAX protease family)